MLVVKLMLLPPLMLSQLLLGVRQFPFAACAASRLSEGKQSWSTHQCLLWGVF
jgi:hypothetical protein